MKKAQLKGSPAAMAIIVVMLLGILAFFAVVPAPYREGMLPELPTTDYENVVLDANPGVIEEGAEDTSIDRIDLSAVTIDNSPKVQEQYISDQLLLKKSLFNAEYIDYDFDIDTSTFSSANLHFVISEKIGDGVLIVRVNQHSVFSREVGVGETLDINIPKHRLHEATNTLRISVLGSGAKFWQSNAYVLTNARLNMNNYIEESAEQSFYISKNSAKEMDEATLTALVGQLGGNVNLRVELNGEQIYNAIPPSSLSIELPEDSLNSGYNTLTWSADRDGKYSIRYGKVIIKEIEIEEGSKRYYFSVSDRDMHFVNQPSKYICELLLVKQSGDNEITISINSDGENYKFENGEVREDICDKLKEGTNKIILTVDEETIVTDLVLTIKNN